jgi:hypothetical protein
LSPDRANLPLNRGGTGKTRIEARSREEPTQSGENKDKKRSSFALRRPFQCDKTGYLVGSLPL